MKKTMVFLVLLSCSITSYSQAQYQPYSYQSYQKLNSSANLHTAIKPYLTERGSSQLLDSLSQDTMPTKRGWLYRKVFLEHLISVERPDYSFYADYLPDHSFGRDQANKKGIWMNGRGFQVGVDIGTKFSFYTSGFENQAVFPKYFNDYVDEIGIIPGQAYDHSNGDDTKDWSYVTALISYTPIKYLNITLGQDKTFIGDGYRSMFLSDYSSPYPFLKLTANLGKVKYMTMWSLMDDPSALKIDQYGNERRKWGVFQYLDWNVSKKFSLGFFQAVIWADADDFGHKRGFDFKYINPIIFLRTVQAASGSPDNSLLGLSGKFKFSDKLAVYGQLALDEFQAKDFFSSNGSSRNKYGYQIGIKGSDLAGVNTLNYLLEYNGAKPYSYSHLASITNYAAQNQSLAHPFGANFREFVGLLNYSYKRFDFSTEMSYSKYGLDINGNNFGKDIFKTYQSAPSYYEGNYTGQGLTTDLYFLESKVAYVFNPKYNLRLELGGIYRNEKNIQFAEKTSVISLGLRSGFRNIYNNIAGNRINR